MKKRYKTSRLKIIKVSQIMYFVLLKKRNGIVLCRYSMEIYDVDQKERFCHCGEGMMLVKNCKKTFRKGSETESERKG